MNPIGGESPFFFFGVRLQLWRGTLRACAYRGAKVGGSGKSMKSRKSRKSRKWDGGGKKGA